MPDLYLTNSLTRQKEKFEPIAPPNVGMYTCGMTVYDYAHIGHGRKYTADDVLRRTLERFGFKVKHVQNVTDVGHLVSDADEGEDKLEKGARKVGKTVWEVAKFFTDQFYASMDKLNILRPTVIAKATEHIPEQIELIKRLMEKGYAYDTPEAVYYDISLYHQYDKLFGQNLAEKKTAVREEVQTGEHKRNPADFALWFKRVGRFANHAMHWGSPWGDGFPGWHVECSAMSMKYLGEQFDIHTGGVDHLSVHHPNEIAQSEGATGKTPFVKYWLHSEFLMVDGRKMSKSLGNLYTVDDVEAKDFDPLALRYLYLTAHYSKPLNFTWESLTAAQTALNNLRSLLTSLKSEEQRTMLSPEKEKKRQELADRFDEALADDLNTPQALAVVWKVVKSNIPSPDKYDLLMSFDEVLGLDLGKVSQAEKVSQVPQVVRELLEKRENLRKTGRYQEADEVRKQIEEKGFEIKDTPEGPQVILAHHVKNT